MFFQSVISPHGLQYYLPSIIQSLRLSCQLDSTKPVCLSLLLPFSFHRPLSRHQMALQGIICCHITGNIRLCNSLQQSLMARIILPS